MKVLLFYDTKGKYGPLTNFYILKNGINIEDENFMTTEHYYQTMKFRYNGETDKLTTRLYEYSNLIKNADTPMKTKVLGHQKRHGRFGNDWVLNKNSDRRLLYSVLDEYSDLCMNPEWNKVGILVMIDALYAKFTQYPELRKLLTELQDDTYIVEHTTRDKIWGDGGDGGSGEIGQNRLGKILTALSFCLKYGNCDKMSQELKDKLYIDFS